MKIILIITAFFFLFLINKKSSIKNAVIPAITVDATDQNLSFMNGYWYYKEKLFSGTIIEKYSNNNIHHIRSYLNGKEEGEQQSFYADGKVLEKRFYRNREEDGVQIGWWQNGNKRFEYHFTKGVYNGDFKEWFEDGKLLRWIHYTNGIDDWGMGWRESGKLFMNYVMKDGRRYGIVNSNLCYTVKNEQAELVKSN